ncbi:hypothetical protein, partial [Actinomadura luteofluorescens]
GGHSPVARMGDSGPRYGADRPSPSGRKRPATVVIDATIETTETVETVETVETDAAGGDAWADATSDAAADTGTPPGRDH